jgi:Zn-dependent peptidase ImmA (M78 family)/transcriptional regulator with XRE-family HTH domain
VQSSMSITPRELAKRLREAREASGLTQEEVARHLDLSRPSVAQLELGHRAVSSLELDHLARLYGRDVRDFLAAEFRAEDSLAALLRADPGVSARAEVVAAIGGCIALARELANLEGLLGLDRTQAGVPVYSTPPLRTKWQAVEQGTRVAAEERRRLGLGFRPVGDTVELLESQGVRTALVSLPEDVSGIALMEPSLSLLVVVNRTHAGVRRRFSSVHEYAHVLFDRPRRSTLSRAANRDDLLEVRANAFAAALLMPEEGLREFLADLGKGQPSREQHQVFDGEGVVPAETRSEPGSQSVQLYDVVFLAYHFGCSRIAALYRLRNVHLLSQSDLQHLLAEEEAGRGRAIARSLDLPEPEETARDEFRSRFLGLALEAFRREKITRGKLRELAGAVGLTEEDLERLLEDAGLARDEEFSVLLPGDAGPER